LDCSPGCGGDDDDDEVRGQTTQQKSMDVTVWATLMNKLMDDDFNYLTLKGLPLC
jgi:hypothetical protein